MLSLLASSCALLATLVTSTGCGTAPRLEPPRADAERGYAALRWVPANASYVVVSARTQDLVTSTRELLTAVGLFGEWSLGDVHRGLRSMFSISPLMDDDLVAVGLDLERSAAVFSVGLFPTLVLPIRDRPALVAYFDRQRPSKNVTISRAHGVDVYTYTSGEDLAIGWAALDEWLFVTIRNPEMEASATEWLERALSVPAGEGFASTALFADAVEAARRQLPSPKRLGHELVAEPRRVYPGLVGVIDVDRIWKRLAKLTPAGLRSCRAGLAANGRIYLGADMGWRAGEGVVIIPLAASGANRLRAAIVDVVPDGFRRYRDDSAISLDLNLDLAWLAGLGEGENRCKLFPRLPRRGVARVGGGAVGAYHVAGRDLAPSKRRGQLAVYLAGTKPAFIEKLLDRIPLRSTLERDKKIQGVPVRVIDLPSLPPVVYRAQPRALTLGVGRGVMAQLLDDTPYTPVPEPRGVTILEAAIHPGRLPEIQVMLQYAARAFGIIGHAYFERTQQRLSRYKQGRLRVALDGDAIVIRVGMKLR